MRAPFALAAGLAFLACDSPFSVREFQQILDAERRWEAQGANHYTYEMRTLCFCGSELTDWALVEVRNGSVSGARSLSGVPLTGLALSSRKSVEDLFEIARSERDEWVADVDFDFDAELGYPRRISFEPKKNILDAGTTYEARNLTIVRQYGP